MKSTSIVIVNEFTNRYNSSRGKTLNAYVTDYVSRKTATEPLLFSLYGATADDGHILRHLQYRHTRARAVSTYMDEAAFVDAIQRDMRLHGRAFGHHGLSYTDDRLRLEAERMQQLFDDGHTILKTVVSFETSYLMDMGALPADFVFFGEGSFASQLDNVKLRLALNQGMRDMAQAGSFKEPVWVGAIQIDTNHVHAHFAIADATKETDAKRLVHFEQRGKLHQPELDALRRGIHRTLRRDKAYQALRGVESTHTRLTTAHTQTLTLSRWVAGAHLQQVIAALPKEPTRWVYGVEDEDMMHANSLLDTYMDVLYDLSDGDSLVSREELASRIYASIADIPSSEKSVRTPYLDAVVTRTDSVQDAPLTHPLQRVFVNGLRYRERMVDAYRDVVTYHQLLDAYTMQQRQKGVSAESMAMYQHYRVERFYAMSVYDKYRHFVAPPMQPIQVTVSDEQVRSVYYLAEQAQQSMVVHARSPQATIEQCVAMVATHPHFMDSDQFVGGADGNGQPVSVRAVLDDVLSGQRVHVPPETVHYLNTKGAQTTQLLHVGDTLASAVYKRTQGDNASLLRTLPPVVCDYLHARERHAFSLWQAGQVRASDVPYYMDDVRMVSMHGTLPPVVTPTRTKWIGVSDAYFDSVQPLDLHALGEDIDARSSRAIPRVVSLRYADVLTAREDACTQAVLYVQTTQQSPHHLLQHQRQLAAYRALYDELDDTGYYPMESDRLFVDGSLTSSATLDLQRSSMYVGVHLSQLMDTVTLSTKDEDVSQLDVAEQRQRTQREIRQQRQAKVHDYV